MSLTETIITFGSGLVLGCLSGFVWPQLRGRIAAKKERQAQAERKARILKDLDSIASDVMAAVQEQPHGIQNKDNWVARLQAFAKDYEDLLGSLAGYVRRISYRIEDSAFDHETQGSPPYCCDEVEVDLALLRLCVLPVSAREMGWSPEEIEREEKRLLDRIWLNAQEIRLASEEETAREVDEWHAKWKAGEFEIHHAAGSLAMAPYVNHELKEVRRKEQQAS